MIDAAHLAVDVPTPSPQVPIYENHNQTAWPAWRNRAWRACCLRVDKAIMEGKTRVIDLDLRAYFDNVQHYLLLAKVARRVQDAMVMKLLNMILKSTGKKGVPQGGVVSPLLSNDYLNEVDKMLEKAIDTTRRGKYTHVQYARFADDMVILIDSHPRNDWLMRAVDKRLREELAKLRVEINEDKSRTIDLTKGGSFAFLGFEYRRVLGCNQKWRPQFVPKMKKRTALFAKLREVFQQHVSQPVGEVIEEINPILRGWVNYFRIGHSSRCFSKIRDWVGRQRFSRAAHYFNRCAKRPNPFLCRPLPPSGLYS
jgi:RNA-directed DNA polymerase